MNSPKIGETVHYVRLNGACLPALVVGYSAAIAAAKRSADADYLLATAQEDMKAAQARVAE